MPFRRARLLAEVASPLIASEAVSPVGLVVRAAWFALADVIPLTRGMAPSRVRSLGAVLRPLVPSSLVLLLQTVLLAFLLAVLLVLLLAVLLVLLLAVLLVLLLPLLRLLPVLLTSLGLSVLLLRSLSVLLLRLLAVLLGLLLSVLLLRLPTLLPLRLLPVLLVPPLLLAADPGGLLALMGLRPGALLGAPAGPLALVRPGLPERLLAAGVAGRLAVARLAAVLEPRLVDRGPAAGLLAAAALLGLPSLALLAWGRLLASLALVGELPLPLRAFAGALARCRALASLLGSLLADPASVRRRGAVGVVPPRWVCRRLSSW